jgi:DnaK suppressor protein
MTTRSPAFDPAFLTLQRDRLLVLRRGLTRAIQDDAEEAIQVLSADQDHANELEDQAQNLTIAENDRILSTQLGQQRIVIDRALAKLEEGTYGFSDVSGFAIPIGRLKAFPQAVTTVAEELAPKAGPAS